VKPREGQRLGSFALGAADGVVEKVGMLQPRELDGEAVFEMAHDATRHFAEGDQRPDRRPLVAGDAGAGLRNVNNAPTAISSGCRKTAVTAVSCRAIPSPA
jgi:hypothetical protein